MSSSVSGYREAVTSSGAPGLTAAPGPAPEARPGRLRGLLDRVPSATLRERVLELVRFGSVGAVAFVVDLGVYNLLRFGPVDALHGKPLTARIIAVLLATLVSWLGSRHWTFAGRRAHRGGHELALFGAINLVGIGFTVGALGFSHYVLGMSGPFSDNVANVVGIVLGTAVRYAGYKLFVFPGAPAALAQVGHEARAEAASGTVPRPRPGTADPA